MHFTHRGNALHPMGEIFPQDSSQKPYKTHRMRLPTGFSFSPHRRICFTLWVRFSHRIPRESNPDSCVLHAGFLRLGHRNPGLGFLWPLRLKGSGRLGLAGQGRRATNADLALLWLSRSLHFQQGQRAPNRRQGACNKFQQRGPLGSTIPRDATNRGGLQ